MDNEEKFWLTLWKYVCVTLCILFLCITSSCQITKYTLKKMVEAGADPISASCALAVNFNNTIQETAQCIAHELNRNN